MKKTLYRQYSEHLQEKYGKRVYKLPVNLPGTCPNRDGKVGQGGCIFCDEQGSGFDCLDNTFSIKQQLDKNKAYFRKRFKAEKFIVYFQAFTNTYMPFEKFRQNIWEAVAEDDLVAVAISTRPDCINDLYLDFLQGIGRDKHIDLNIELGLQTVNYHTLSRLNRGHSLAEFIDAVYRIKTRGIAVCTHLILNLPGDDYQDALENAKIISALQVEYVKLHSLYIVEGTPLGDMYRNAQVEIIPMQDYIERVAGFLTYLDPNIVLQRLVGKGPQDKLLFCNWGASWWLVKERIEAYMESNGLYQGKNFDYLNGKALKGLY